MVAVVGVPLKAGPASSAYADKSELGAAAQVASAFKNLLAAASPEAGAGTNPLVPPEPLSPTIIGQSEATLAIVIALGD
jgi:hypothetical protein